MPSRSVSIRPEVEEIEDDEGLALPRAVLLRKLLRLCLRHPADTLGVVVMLAMAVTIVGNALFRQSGPDPNAQRSIKAPKASHETTGSFIVMPRPRPPEAEQQAAAMPSARPRAQIVTDLQRELQRRGFYDGTIDGIQGPKMDAAVSDFSKAAGLHSSGEPSEALLQAIVATPAKITRAKPAARAPTAAHISAVQRVLSQFGYGQIKVTGALDAPTKAAVEKFEREHKMPVTGQVSDRLLRELAAVTGRPVE